MPLPAGGKTTWPPKELEHVQARIASWSAWYSGNPDELSGIYGGTQDRAHEFLNRPAQYKGGVVGALARWFWGAPTPQGEQRTKIHAPIAGDIAAKSAKLLFSEPPAFTMPKAHGAEKSASTTTQDRLAELVDDSVHASLLESGEVCAGLGGVYVRAVWDRNMSDKPWLSSVHPDAAVPEWRWGRLSAVTFWRVLAEDGNTVVRHLERHEPGSILHGVYEGTSEHLGQVVPLANYSETASLAAGMVEGNRVVTGVPRLTAVYVPNMKPNRVWRNNPSAAHLGRSDFSGTEGFMDSLDEIYTSWMRDIRLAKGRAFVPDAYLQNNGPGRGASFDAEREIYATLNMLPSANGPAQLTLHQFAIRVEEHARSAQEWLIRIVSDSGYSPQTFLQGDVAVTATEVVARERQSFLTRNHKILYWRPALAEIIETLLMIDAVRFGSGVTPEQPDIEFPDGVAPDPEATARTLQLLQAAEAVSVQTKVEMLHPDWDEVRRDDEVKRILGESGRLVEDPGTFRGGAPAATSKPGDDSAEDEEPPEEE